MYLIAALLRVVQAKLVELDAIILKSSLVLEYTLVS